MVSGVLSRRRLSTVAGAGAVLLAFAGLGTTGGAQPRPSSPPPSHAVRPFITDDARTVGGRLSQVESWYRRDAESGQLWLLAAHGPVPRLELTVGGVVGNDFTEPGAPFTWALPLVQGKFLVRPYRDGGPPGVAVVAGSFFPGGSGLLKPPAHGAFSYLSLTQQVGPREALLLHGNLGVNHLWIGDGRTLTTWGLGAQGRVVGGLHGVAELFSGDPYVPGSGTAWQAGVRHFVSEWVQVDATVGRGVSGAVVLPTWWSLGVRWVFRVGPAAAAPHRGR
jgi:hypothetical protein